MADSKMADDRRTIDFSVRGAEPSDRERLWQASVAAMCELMRISPHEMNHQAVAAEAVAVASAMLDEFNSRKPEPTHG